MFLRCVIAVSASLLCTAGLFAQSRTDEYGYPDTDDIAPDIRTDTALFFNSLKNAGNLYSQVAGYRFSFVENRRRNNAAGRNELLCDGVAVPVSYGWMLRSLGARAIGTTMADALSIAGRTAVEAEIYSFDGADGMTGTTGSVGTIFSTALCSAALKADVAAPIGRGWGLTAAVDARTGRDMQIDGLFLNSAGASLRLVKHFASGGGISFLATAEPSERGMRMASTAEAFALTGNNLYNPSWGWQNGRQRNSRVNREMIPLAAASLSMPLSESTTIGATVAARLGTRRRSSLGWYDAATPMPDNYRYLPSSMTGPSASATAEAWRAGDARYTQIDWDELYAENRMSDHGAVYALDDRVRRITDLQAAVSAVTRPAGGIVIRYGADVRYLSERQYREMRDLLGGPFIIDIDYYLVDDDTFANSLQNDLRNPNRMIREGDRFGYDYALVRRSASLHADAAYTSGRFDMRVAGRIGTTSMRRRGYFEKELFAGSGSYGDSERLRFATYSAAAGFGWSFSPRRRLGLTLYALAGAPEAGELFLNPQYNNRTVGDASAVRRQGAEITADVATRTVCMQAVVFADIQRGAISTMQYYDDLAGEFCDMSAGGIGILTCGVEAAATMQFARRWDVDVTLTALQCRYASDPTVRVWADRDNRIIDGGSPSRMGDCIPGGVPRLAASLSAAYRSESGWRLALSAAWAGARRAEPSFLRRTERVAYQGASSPEAFDAIVTQERLPDAFDTELLVAKSWQTGGRSGITVSVSLRNLSGERGNIYTGYESHRVRRVSRGIQSDYLPLPTRYLYSRPRTAVVTVSYSF